MSERERIETAIARRNEIVEGVRTVLIERLGVRRSPQEIDPDAPLFGTGLGLDSVDAVELVVSLEAQFHIHVPPGVMDRRALRTVGTVADAVIAMQDRA
jgi:acyl carrier protein